MSTAEPVLAEYLTKEQLASELRRNPRTLDRWEVLGMGPPRTLVGRQILYRRSSLLKWLAGQEKHGRSSTAAAERSSTRNLRGTL